MIQEEIWKDIPEYEGMYQVSNLGRVKSLPRTITYRDGRKGLFKETILKQGISRKGYLKVYLSKKSKKYTVSVHKLVAMAFLGFIPTGTTKGLVVDHKNEIKTDNRVENLQLITNRENCSKCIKNASSKYTGVSWLKSSKKWRARIQIDGKDVHLGLFLTEEGASQAYQKALKSL